MATVQGTDAATVQGTDAATVQSAEMATLLSTSECVACTSTTTRGIPGSLWS